jgi:membrane protease YdiL (CAAX protease family)
MTTQVNREVRFWARDQLLGGGVPFWLDNMLLMVTFQTVVWATIALLLIGRRGVALTWPVRSRESWVVAVLSGLALVALMVGAIAFSGAALEWRLRVNLPLDLANLVSNFEEELVGRGAVLGLLRVVLGRERSWLCTVLSALLFCQGHVHYAWLPLATVFAAGLLWAAMTVRYQSIWPAWISHTVVDVVGDMILK